MLAADFDITLMRERQQEAAHGGAGHSRCLRDLAQRHFRCEACKDRDHFQSARKRIDIVATGGAEIADIVVGDLLCFRDLRWVGPCSQFMSPRQRYLSSRYSSMP